MIVSIIITTYNYGHFVERAIRSVLAQSLAKDNYELIIIDDCSTDMTKDVLSNYENEAIIFSLDKNVGLSASRNIGIKKSKGKYVYFLDADDYIHVEAIRVLKTILETNSNIDSVSSDYLLVDKKGKHIKHVNAIENPIACGIMFRKDLLYKIGLYDESFLAREEEDLRIRFEKKYQIYNVPSPLYRYWLHDQNMTKDQSKMNLFKKKLDDKHIKSIK